MSKKTKQKEDTLLNNKKARFNYTIEDTFEAGLVLKGSEVKVLREKQGSLLEAFVVYKKGEFYLQNCHIPEYTNGGYANHAPLRIRKILMNRAEIDRLQSLVKEKGYSLVPIKMYKKERTIKLLLGTAKGKRQVDKRNSLKEKSDKKRMKEFV